MMLRLVLTSALFMPLVFSYSVENFQKQNVWKNLDNADVNLVTFDGDESTAFTFHELNDPVMGGVSTGSWELNLADGFGVFNGTVKDVPSLHAPGFLSAYARGKFNDASHTISGGLVLKVRTSTPEYTGFRVSFAAGTVSPLYSCSNGGIAPFSNGCFKSKFDVPAGDNFIEVRLPFSSFSDHWNPATGEPTVTCEEDTKVCPTGKDLSHIQWIEVWAEGVAGDIHLELESIYASPSLDNDNIERTQIYIPLVTFDGNPTTTHEFTQLNDPVMGGASVGTWTTETNDGGYGIMNGTVNDIPFLGAPGFIKARALYSDTGHFNDASKAISGDMVLKVRSTTSDYNGYRISFASGSYVSPEYSCANGGYFPFSGGCFKAKFFVPPGNDFSEVRIPFTMFSDHWSPATGDQTKTCSEDPKVCPTAKDLAGIKDIELWAEGVKGAVHLEIRSIAAEMQ